MAKLLSLVETFNGLTHLAGVIFALASAWAVLGPAYDLGWAWAMGATFFVVSMLIMFSMSTAYHFTLPGKAKKVMRVFDHIGIYIMIAGSYTPICIGVIGGWLGWLVFGLMWACAIGGTVYKIAAIGKYPRLSLALYLIMGWSVVLIAYPVYQALSSWAITWIVTEGVLYTAGTYFYAHDKQYSFFHPIWHIFVLLGAVAHWAAVYCMCC